MTLTMRYATKHASRNAGSNSGPDRSASLPGGGRDDSCRQNDRHTEARERAMMKALDLIL